MNSIGNVFIKFASGLNKKFQHVGSDKPATVPGKVVNYQNLGFSYKTVKLKTDMHYIFI